MSTTWKTAWLERNVRRRSADLWRGVEAQHVIATMRLVDSNAEQIALEQLLESNKPPPPPAAVNQHYLLFTPYRYRPPQGTRFTHPGHAGIWYGAEYLETACAEVAYWRWRFLMDSNALVDQALHTEHTFFQAQVAGSCIDLSAKPWNEAAAKWMHKTDYSHCRALADAAAAGEIKWIRYVSVRKAGDHCGAVLNSTALSLRPDFPQQSWACKTTRHGAYMQHASSRTRHEFSAEGWA